jgi:hypothetical protein
MAKNIVGSSKKFTVEGIAYRLAGDANIGEVITRYENSMIATSGESMRKMVRRVPAREAVDLILNSAEADQLKSFSEGLDNLTISYTNAAGDRFVCRGTLEIEKRESDTGKTTCKIEPVDDWTFFEG